MLGRNRQKMDEKEEVIKKARPGVEVRKIQIDFSQSGEVHLLEGIMDIIKDIDVSIVVNNVGIGTNNTPMLDMDMQYALDMIVVNCIPQAVFDRLFVPRLLQREKRSAILDVGSIAGTASLPGKEIYCGTKYFNRAVNSSISQGPGHTDKIDFLTLKPAFVSTNLVRNRKPDLVTVTVDECVTATLKVLGQKSETFGAGRHVVFGTILQALFFLVPTDILFSAKDHLYDMVGYMPFKNSKKEE